MKKTILTILSTLMVALGVSVATAGATSPTSQYWICSDPSLKAVWAYPTGSYWQAQIAHYPAYYAQPSINSYYTAKYGC